MQAYARAVVLRLCCYSAAAALATPVVVAQVPVWHQTMAPGQVVEYFRYGAPEDSPNPADRRYEEGLEQWWADKTATSRPPYVYQWDRFPVAGSVTRSSCQITHYPNQPLYYVSPTGDNYAGVHPDAAAQEFHVSRQEAGVKGIQILAEFSSVPALTPQGAYGEAVEAAFFTDRRCTDGGREYGFANYGVRDQLVFYYSDYTNCGPSYCNLNSSGGAASAVGATVREFEIASLQSYTNGQGQQSRRFFYDAFFNGSNNFVVQLINPESGALASCQIWRLDPQTGGRVQQMNSGNTCFATITPESFLTVRGPINGSSGYVATVIQQANTAAFVPAGTVFRVDQVNVAQ